MDYFLAWVEAYSGLLTFVATTIGILFIYWQIRAARIAAKAEVSLRLLEFWDREPMRRSRGCLHNLSVDRNGRLHYEKVKANDEVWKAFLDVCTFFEELGILVEHGAIDLRMANDMFGSTVLERWERYASVIEADRAEEQRPSYFGSFERLYKEFKKIHTRQSHKGLI